MTVLVAAPTHRCKDYALDAYLEAYRNLTYEDRDLLLVDNTEDDEYWRELIEKDVPHVRRCKWEKKVHSTVDNAWDVILKFANDGGYEYVFSVESDVIVAPESIELLVDIAERYDASIVFHTYPPQGRTKISYDLHMKALGCTLLPTKYFPPGSNRHRMWHTENVFPDVAQKTGKPMIECTQLFEVKHIGSGHLFYVAENWQRFPVTKMPKEES